MTESIARCIDHSLLHPTMTDDELRAGCELAKQYHVASVCVKPYAVPLAVEVLEGSGVEVGTVIGFPHGGNLPEVKAQEAALACQQGACELDMVINIGKALSGDWGYVERDIRGVVEVAHKYNAITKVIIENDYLPNDEIKIKLCEICEKAGADFVKTSTGYGFVKQPSGDYNYRGATEDDVRLMRAHCSEKVQVKAAGGVRTYEQALRMCELGVSRIGASATEAIVNAEREAQAARR